MTMIDNETDASNQVRLNSPCRCFKNVNGLRIPDHFARSLSVEKGMSFLFAFPDECKYQVYSKRTTA